MTRRDRYTLAQAAEHCQTTLAVIRKRADRGTLATVKHDGVRYVTHEALEAAGLIADAELTQLRRDVVRLRDELSVHRRLTETAQAEAEAERHGHELVSAALVEQRAIARAAAARAGELEQLERELAAAGPMRAWRLARQQRRVMDRSDVVMSPDAA